MCHCEEPPYACFTKPVCFIFSMNKPLCCPVARLDLRLAFTPRHAFLLSEAILSDLPVLSTSNSDDQQQQGAPQRINTSNGMIIPLARGPTAGHGAIGPTGGVGGPGSASETCLLQERYQRNAVILHRLLAASPGTPQVTSIPFINPHNICLRLILPVVLTVRSLPPRPRAPPPSWTLYCSLMTQSPSVP